MRVWRLDGVCSIPCVHKYFHTAEICKARGWALPRWSLQEEASHKTYSFPAGIRVVPSCPLGTHRFPTPSPRRETGGELCWRLNTKPSLQIQTDTP